MKNKEQLLMDIEKLPIFVLSDIYTKAEDTEELKRIAELENIKTEGYIKENRLLGVMLKKRLNTL